MRLGDASLIIQKYAKKIIYKYSLIIIHDAVSVISKLSVTLMLIKINVISD